MGRHTDGLIACLSIDGSGAFPWESLPFRVLNCQIYIPADRAEALELLNLIYRNRAAYVRGFASGADFAYAEWNSGYFTWLRNEWLGGQSRLQAAFRREVYWDSEAMTPSLLESYYDSVRHRTN